MWDTEGNVVAIFVALGIFTAVGQGCVPEANAQLRAPSATMADLKAAQDKYKARCWLHSGSLYCRLPEGKTVQIVNGEAQ